MRNMLAEDIAAGHGVTVVDPHGQLVEDILENHIPRHRTNDVIYFNPKDQNALSGLTCSTAPGAANGAWLSQMSSAFSKNSGQTPGDPAWKTFSGTGFTHSSNNRNPFPFLRFQNFLPTRRIAPSSSRTSRILPSSIFSVAHMIAGRTPFERRRYHRCSNKCRAFTTDPLLRAVIGQTRSSFDFRYAMDERKIILCDLSKGAIGGDNAMLLGSLVVMQEKLAALSRTDIPEHDRVPHLLFAEEAQNFIGDFESILAETRKYNLVLAVATQGIESLSRETAAAIFTNAANLIAFRGSNTDADRFSDEFMMVFPERAFRTFPTTRRRSERLFVMTTDAGRPRRNRLPPIPRRPRTPARNGAPGSNVRVMNVSRSRAPWLKPDLRDSFWVGQDGKKVCEARRQEKSSPDAV